MGKHSLLNLQSERIRVRVLVAGCAQPCAIDPRVPCWWLFPFENHCVHQGIDAESISTGRSVWEIVCFFPELVMVASMRPASSG